MKPATRLFRKVRRGVQTVAYGNPLYQKILASGETPDRLCFTLPDLWPGDVQAGLALITGQRSLFEAPSSVLLRHASAALRDLRAVGTDAARQVAVRLIDNWLQHHDSWHEDEWAPDVLGARLAGWIGFYEFYAPAATPDFTARLTASLHRQWKHLARTLPSTLVGVGGLQALRGLVYGGLNFPEGDKALGLAIDLLQRQCAAEILTDGGHASRSPSVQLHMLKHLIDLRAVFRATGEGGREIADVLHAAIVALVPALKFYRHGDGGLALFHGSIEEKPLLIEAVLTQAEARGRVLHRLPQTRYERVTAGRSLLLVDCGQPAPHPYDATSHAGLLSFEFGCGRERLIVNCGAVDQGNEAWRMACAATAAHSTLTVEDTHACEILPSGGLASVPHVEAQRYEQEDTQFIEIMHEGYVSKFGVTHQRILSLTHEGEELRGRDILTGVSGRNFTLRWHLHPAVQASLAQSGQAALLRTPSGSGWRLRIEQGDLELDSSVSCGTGTPRRSLQLKVNGRTDGAETVVSWSLVREKKG